MGNKAVKDLDIQIFCLTTGRSETLLSKGGLVLFPQHLSQELLSCSRGQQYFDLKSEITAVYVMP